MENEKEIRAEKTIELPIDWDIPDGARTAFVTNMVVQNAENEFRVYFFDIKPPLRLDPTEPPPTKVKADYVTSIVVTAERLPKFIEVLQKQLDKYMSKKQAE